MAFVRAYKFSRALKKSFLRKFSCKNPNNFEGRFFKTCHFQQPARVLAAQISLLLYLSAITSMFAAEHLEIQVSLRTTWKSQTQTNEHEATAICIVGTNGWYISGQFLKNAYVEYWLRGTNVIERKVITSSMYLEQVKDFVSEKIGTRHPRTLIGRYPPKGESSMRTNSWLEPFGYSYSYAYSLPHEGAA